MIKRKLYEDPDHHYDAYIIRSTDGSGLYLNTIIGWTPSLDMATTFSGLTDTVSRIRNLASMQIPAVLFPVVVIPNRALVFKSATNIKNLA